VSPGHTLVQRIQLGVVRDGQPRGQVGLQEAGSGETCRKPQLQVRQGPGQHVSTVYRVAGASAVHWAIDDEHVWQARSESLKSCIEHWLYP
jgi:hypothetical protein